MNFKHIVREYFSYSTSEKNGLLVLVVLLVIMYFLPLVFQPGEVSEFVIDQKKQIQIDSLISSIENKEIHKKEQTLFTNLDFFDPNKTSKEELINLGFTPFQTNNLIKFRNKGGRFKAKTDLLKIYGITQSDLEIVNDYIRISVDENSKKESRVRTKKEYHLFSFDPNVISLKEWNRLGVDKRTSIRIKNYLAAGGCFRQATDLKKIYDFDSVKLAELLPYVKIVVKANSEMSLQKILVQLNSSDTTQLKQLPGIGSVLSARIVKYRDLLGGFASKDQLLEVYGISEEKLIRIESSICVDSISIRKLIINSFDALRLRKHPYINQRIAKDIIRYRERNGNFTSVSQLQTHKLVPDSIFLKLVPYLELN
ncbi:helix-hairpin-helix domain-containing protein [Labilibaculum sp. K2S]|uniref:helix-hairpin-helix domain-containing protein n=1 Tax=Labilibaculum sp. K2S TaxID=3056386 RepID=UPI0025A465AD|nr:helix-hairpin-helix domain-containing protein [Labilibaculum sp. K2S]MDM8159397.1 helix-hairpin-helix domain-containing protein [Labilibaculum sp. K2S]